MSEAVRRVSAFLESYRAAFERWDAPAIANHFAFPSHITSDAGQISLTSIAGREEWIGHIERLLEMYRAIGLSSVQVLDATATELSPHLAQAIVHWALLDRAGRVLYDFQAMYTLATIDDRQRIAAIAHNEIPRYRECAERLQLAGTVGGDFAESPTERPD